MNIEFNEVLYTDLGRKPDHRGKVRDIYDLGGELLIVSTDRISAYDRILPNGIPGRGKILTKMSVFWFDMMKKLIPNHLISSDVNEYPEELQKYSSQLEDRSMLCHKADRVDVECVARGYLAGSGWREYRESGTICGIELPESMVESEKLPEPIFTPATKAPEGEHDENISFENLVDMVGNNLANKLHEVTLLIYSTARDYAIKKGIIIADTKFEFGFINDELSLIDEILSPDSSRFWDLDLYEPGKSQDSFDKQFVRDWLSNSGFHGEGKPPVLPQRIIDGTIERYIEVCDRLLSE